MLQALAQVEFAKLAPLASEHLHASILKMRAR
jgi:hypothetical protein